MDAGQQQLLDLINEGISKGTGPLAEMFNFSPEKFKEGVSNPIMKQFQEDILPQLQHKFINNNNLLGSSFQKAQAKAGTDLQSKLAALMYEAQNQKDQQKLSGIQTALGKQTVENQHQPGTGGAVQSLLKGAGEGIGKAVAAWVTGGASTLFDAAKSVIAG